MTQLFYTQLNRILTQAPEAKRRCKLQRYLRIPESTRNLRLIPFCVSSIISNQ